MNCLQIACNRNVDNKECLRVLSGTWPASRRWVQKLLLVCTSEVHHQVSRPEPAFPEAAPALVFSLSPNTILTALKCILERHLIHSLLVWSLCSKRLGLLGMHSLWCPGIGLVLPHSATCSCSVNLSGWRCEGLCKDEHFPTNLFAFTCWVF